MNARARPVRPSSRRRVVRGAFVVAGGVLVFATGIALGQALADSPSSGTRTSVRTLRPLPLAPTAPTRTVTITVTAP